MAEKNTAEEREIHTCGHTSLFGIIGLNAANVGWLLGHQDLHQLGKTHLKLSHCLPEKNMRRKKVRWDERETRKPPSCPNLSLHRKPTEPKPGGSYCLRSLLVRQLRSVKALVDNGIL